MLLNDGEDLASVSNADHVPRGTPGTFDVERKDEG